MRDIELGILKRFISDLDSLVNADKYSFKFMIHDVIDSYTGQPVATICVVRDITDYDQPIEYVFVEHFQGQWFGTTVYINVAWRSDFTPFCVLRGIDASLFFHYVIEFIKHGKDLHAAVGDAFKEFGHACQETLIDLVYTLFKKDAEVGGDA